MKKLARLKPKKEVITNKKRGEQIKATFSAWADSCGLTVENLKQKFTRCGLEWKTGVMVPACQVIQAITFRNEKDEAIARQANAKAEEQEMINAERRKELMELAQIEKIVWNDLLAPLRLELEQMPKSLCGMCNPEEPEVAQKVLGEWVEKTKLNIKPKK